MEREDRLVVLAVLKNKVMAAYEAEREAFTAGARRGSSFPAMIGNEAVAKVSLPKASESFRVVDMDALVAWAVAHAPDLVDFAPRIPDEKRRMLLKDPTTPDGELVPGVEPYTAQSGPRVSWDARDRGATAERLVEDAIRTGALSFSDVLALESGA